MGEQLINLKPNNYGYEDLLADYAAKRIQQSFSPSLVVQEVFPTESNQHSFVNCLGELKGGVIRVGGRRLRELIGCKVFNMAGDIKTDPEFLDIHQSIRLGPILSELSKYPEERMTKPDLDFFVDGLEPAEIADTFNQNGFAAKINDCTGGVQNVSIEGEEGEATFINSAQSWQTGTSWPMYGFTAPLDTNTNEFKLDISAMRLFLHPLHIPEMNPNPMDPQRVSAMARALLWSVTSSDSNGMPLRAPLEQLKDYTKTVEGFYKLLSDVKKNPELEKYYRSGIRDMSVALRIILLNDWDQMNTKSQIVSQRAEFFNQITSAWYIGKLHQLNSVIVEP